MDEPTDITAQESPQTGAPQTDDAYQAAKARMAEAAKPAMDRLDDAEREAFTAMTEATAKALGDETGAEAVAAQILFQSTEAATTEATPTPDMAETWAVIREELDRSAEAVASVTIDGTEYRCAAFGTLTGRRRGRVLSIITDQAETAAYLFMNAYNAVVAITQIASVFQDSPRWLEFLGAMYLPVNGEEWRPGDDVPRKDRDAAWGDHFYDIGERINEQLTADGAIGVLRRFFSLSGSGLPAPIRALLTRFQSAMPQFAAKQPTP